MTPTMASPGIPPVGMVNRTLRLLEWAISPARFLADWPLPREESGVWYWGPAGHLYGYGVATSEHAAAWSHARIRDAAVAKVRQIPWC